MKRVTDVTFENVGMYFLRDDEVWKMIGYCNEPTIYMMKVGNMEEKHSFGISALAADQYTLLVPKVKP